MNNINKAQSATRVPVLLIAFLLLVLPTRFPHHDAASLVSHGVQKVHDLQRQADQVVRFSTRLYHFYKVVSQKPTMQACAR